MSSILSQYEVYFHPHEPFVFSWHILSSSVNWFFLRILHKLLGAHGSLTHIIYQAHSAFLNYQLVIVRCLVKHVATEPYAQLLASYYMTSRHIQERCYCGLKSSKPRPCLHTYCAQKRGVVTAHFHQEHDAHTETGKFIYKALTLYGKQLLLKHDQSRSHKSAVQLCSLPFYEYCIH